VNLYEFSIFNLCGIYVLSNPMYSMPVKAGCQKGNNLMSIQEVSAERFAQLFHCYHQALASEPGSASNLHTEEAWENLPPSERTKLIAAARLALLEVELVPSERQSRRYFAKPGEAEWGC
jgi:hypothetical protein